MRGRILAGDFGMVTLIITLSNIVAGVLADTVGVRPTIALFAAIDIAAAVGYLVATRQVRERLLRGRPGTRQRACGLTVCSAVKSPLSTWTTSWPLVSDASTPEPNPCGIATDRS